MRNLKIVSTKFIDNLNAGLGLEEALLKIKVTMEVELKIVELVWKKIIKAGQGNI